MHGTRPSEQGDEDAESSFSARLSFGWQQSLYFLSHLIKTPRKEDSRAASVRKGSEQWGGLWGIFEGGLRSVSSTVIIF